MLLITNVFPSLIGEALQEYEEYNNMPHWISRTPQWYNECLQHWVDPLTHFCGLLYS